ncbi:receptor-like protein kinase HSL1 [Zingiber officinale]|nr:receptor-like protein kinase HSL1 [Zingiber officinale]
MLQNLTLAYNHFASQRIPDEFGNMRSLKYLWMSETQVTGEIPESFQNLKELEHLDLAMNLLNGSIPESIWSLEKLKRIYLYANKLSGEISSEIRATGLEEIDVSINSLNGSIPVGFGNLFNLTKLFMYYNELSGEIPNDIAFLPKLYDIRLFGNRFSGVLPTELGNHSKLTNFEVSDNRISGSLPEGLCAKGALNSVVIFNNNFSGELTAFLADECHTLTNIQLYNNSFSGEFPFKIWSTAVNLTTVLIHHNLLSGTLPDTLPRSLTRLEIEDNLFFGKIPSSTPELQVLKASNNRFSGEIPAVLTGMSRLLNLLLDGNQISGSIPADISALKSLTELNLKNNNLSGNIPPEIGLLSELKIIIDLSWNMLSGPIPPEMGNLKLNSLNLSHNQLSGEIPLQLQNQAYEQSFSENPDLCSSKSIVNIKLCAHRTASIDNKSSQRLIRIFLVLGGFMILMVTVIGILVCRWQPDVIHELLWKLTSFQKVDFTEANIIGKLTVENLIGKGGSGEVYRIDISNHTSMTVAVKKIWNTRKTDWKMEKAFEAEVKILGEIRHANIVKLLCCISNADSKLLVYEYMENGSLDQWLHRRRARPDSEHNEPLNWPKRLGIAIDAAKGLCYMHHHCPAPVIHRDVKSSNILLDSEFRAKIADFGLARMLLKAGEPESASAMGGTFGYMAPECGYSWKITNKVDIYSFGVVLLELTTGREALDGDEHENLAGWVARQQRENGNVMELIDKDLNVDVDYLDDIVTVLSLGIECTSRNPASRPSMKDVLHNLMECDRRDLDQRKFDISTVLQTKRWSLQRSSSAADEEYGHSHLMDVV